MSTVQLIAFERERTTSDAGLRKRAFKLARSGVCRDLDEIGRRLKLEGYASTSIEASLAQRSISADLERILRVANNM